MLISLFKLLSKLFKCFKTFIAYMNYDNEVNEMAASHKGSKITLAQIVLRRVRDIVRGDQSEARRLINLLCVTKTEQHVSSIHVHSNASKQAGSTTIEQTSSIHTYQKAVEGR